MVTCRPIGLVYTKDPMNVGHIVYIYRPSFFIMKIVHKVITTQCIQLDPKAAAVASQ